MYEANYSMYSVFPVIFEKHFFLLNFKMKRLKVRNHLQVNVTTQSTPSYIFHILVVSKGMDTELV